MEGGECYVFLIARDNLVGDFSPYSATDTSGSGPPHYQNLPIPLRHTIVGRTSLDEWSARRRNVYNTTCRYPCPRRDSRPQPQQANGCRPTPETAQPLRSALSGRYWRKLRQYLVGLFSPSPLIPTQDYYVLWLRLSVECLRQQRIILLLNLTDVVFRIRGSIFDVAVRLRSGRTGVFEFW